MGRQSNHGQAFVCGFARAVAEPANLLNPLGWWNLGTYLNDSCGGSSQFNTCVTLNLAEAQIKQVLADHQALGSADAAGHIAPGVLFAGFRRFSVPRTPPAPRLPGVGDDVVVIGKVDDLYATTLAPGERTLLDQLPNQGSPRANYVQNDSVLRTEMSRGVPIRDASVSPTTGELVNNTGFLRAERDILLNHGWSFDPKSSYWSPPG